MKNANPGAIVYIDNKVYIVKKKVGLYQCWHCVMHPNCQDYLVEHMFVPCFDFLIQNPINSPEAGLILRKPFKLTSENMRKYWPEYSVVELHGKVGIVITSCDLCRLPDTSDWPCSYCMLLSADCADFRCLPHQRHDCMNVVVMPIETAIDFNIVQVIKTDKDND